MIGHSTSPTITIPAEWTGPTSPPAATACLQRRNQAVPKICGRVSLECLDHLRRYPLVRQQISRPQLHRFPARQRGCRARQIRYGPPCRHWRRSPSTGGTRDLRRPGHTRDMAVRAESPCSIWRRRRVPRRGSVMFWEQAAPSPGATWAHLAATAGLEDETTTPNCPVRSHRPANEKIVPPCWVMDGGSWTGSPSAFCSRSSGITPLHRSRLPTRAVPARTR